MIVHVWAVLPRFNKLSAKAPEGHAEGNVVPAGGTLLPPSGRLWELSAESPLKHKKAVTAPS